MNESFDCIVVGGGHAGCCSAISAVQSGCKRVLIVEKAPQTWAGGNGYFTAGAHRTVHGGLHDLLPLVVNVPPEKVSMIEIEPYTIAQFEQDIMRLGDGRSDPELVRAVVHNSRDVIGWLARDVGVKFTLSFNRQAYQVNGRQKFWGGLALSVEDGGKGLIAGHLRAILKAGVEIWYETPAVELVIEGGAVTGVVVRKGGELLKLTCHAIILAAGGFESSAELRAEHLGKAWTRARVRGTPYNTGDGIALARAARAQLTGDWSGCHSTCWDAAAPADTGDRELSNQFTKSGYPLGIMLNARGRRFVDEGADFRNYTYAKFGRAVLHEPDGVAWQIWDARGAQWLREEEYGDGVTKKITASSIDELAESSGFAGDDKVRFIESLEAYNAAVYAYRAEHPGLKWDPAVKDGLSTQSLSISLNPSKSNWAMPIDQPPFLAVKIACGITFTFGGVAIDPETAGVLSAETGKPLKGLFSTGEMVGGLFYGNYPGGSGLTAGAVFGRKAGQGAAKLLKVSVL